jgi:hypothetical protein
MSNYSNFKRPQQFIDKICPTCSCIFKVSRHLKEKYHKRFCSSTCSATFNNKGRVVSEQQKNNLSIKCKKRLAEKGPWGAIRNIKPVTSRICLECKKEFIPERKKRNRKTCSQECYKQYRNKHMPVPKTIGGYRPGSGRSKHGYYKGIYCGSTYELCWAIYNLDHNIKFTRFSSCLERDGLKYYPDFLLDDKKTIIEIKGYESPELVERKNKLAESFGYNVIVLRKNDLEHIFDYVKEKYKVTDFQKLYDDYKPTYTYKCTNCNKQFNKELKLKTENKFCSRSCSGKFRAKQLPTLGVDNRPKFNKEQVMAIYNNKTSTYKQLANLFCTTTSTIDRIKNKKNHKKLFI